MTKKFELGLRYFPDAPSNKAAVENLHDAIVRCKGLQQALTALDHSKTAKEFTPREVALIMEYLGEP